MLPRISSVKHIRNFELEVGFTDGTLATLDLRGRIDGRGGVFQALQDTDYFKQVVVDREAGTLVWPNGVDFCPDVLYSQATGKSVPIHAEGTHVA
jgi:hypothetical protein